MIVKPDHAALVDRCQDGDLVVAGPAEGPAVVQVDGVGGVAENLEEGKQWIAQKSGHRKIKKTELKSNNKRHSVRGTLLWTQENYIFY